MSFQHTDKRNLRCEAFLDSARFSASGDNVPDKPSRTPDVGIISLVPVHKALPARDPRNGRPTPSQADVVLAVEEVLCVSRIQVHCLEAGEGREVCASPFPKAAEGSLAGEGGAVGDRGWVPVGEADITVWVIEVDEMSFGIEGGGRSINGERLDCSIVGIAGLGPGSRRRVGGWGLLDAFVAQMSG